MDFGIAATYGTPLYSRRLSPLNEAFPIFSPPTLGSGISSHGLITRCRDGRFEALRCIRALILLRGPLAHACTHVLRQAAR